MKNGRTKLIVLLTVAAVGAVLILLFSDEPRADGRSFSDWLRIGYLRSVSSGARLGQDGDDVAAARAIHKIGARGVPILLAKLGATDPAWKRPVADALRKTSLSLPFHFAEREHAEAVYGFSVLGPQAAGAIPQLANMLLATNASTFVSAYALGYIGREAVPSLKIALTNVDSRIRFWALQGIVMSDEVTRECIPEIMERTTDIDESVASSVMLRLIRFLPPPQSTALMTNALADSRLSIQRVVLRELAARTNGILAGSAIVPLLQSPDHRLRNLATNALRRIDPALAFASGINTNQPMPATNFSGRGGRRGRGPMPEGNGAP